jgi:hypothetical protein
VSNINRHTAVLKDLDTVYVFNDFLDDQSDIVAVDTITDSGTAAVGDAVNGVMVLTPSDGTVADNDECYIATPNELYKFGTNREIYGKFKFQYSAVVAADPNVAVGFMNAPATSAISDNGGVKTSGSTLAVEKKDGETAFRATSACNGTAVTTLSTKAIAAATDYVVEIECKDWDGTSMQVLFLVDGEYLRDTTNNLPIRHTVAIASATEMAMFAGIKLGAATNNDTLSLDYWYGAQTRV